MKTINKNEYYIDFETSGADILVPLFGDSYQDGDFINLGNYIGVDDLDEARQFLIDQEADPEEIDAKGWADEQVHDNYFNQVFIQDRDLYNYFDDIIKYVLITQNKTYDDNLIVFKLLAIDFIKTGNLPKFLWFLSPAESISMGVFNVLLNEINFNNFTDDQIKQIIDSLTGGYDDNDFTIECIKQNQKRFLFQDLHATLKTENQTERKGGKI